MNFANLPQWQCHKKVRAARILEIRDGEGPDSRHLVLDGVPIEDSPLVSTTWLEEKKALVGGYFVFYDDGYTSFSPPGPFESGYTRLAPPSA